MSYWWEGGQPELLDDYSYSVVEQAAKWAQDGVRAAYRKRQYGHTLSSSVDNFSSRD